MDRLYSLSHFPTVLLICCITTFLGASAQNKQLCVTVDDLPVVSYGQSGAAYKERLTLDLIDFFQDNEVPAIGFVNEDKLYTNRDAPDTALVNLLKAWLDRGLTLGNHTYSHKSYHKSDFGEYINDIADGEVITRPLMEAYGQRLRYFRHPFLHIGATPERADSLERHLHSKGLVTSPVTIDNEDYQFAVKYSKALHRGDTLRAQSIGSAYVQYTIDKTRYYEQLSDKVFGRIIAQTLLLHANQLNADYFPELYRFYVEEGYTFVSQAQVLQDDAYQTPITKYGPWGISWLERWAIGQGVGQEIMRNMPPIPAVLSD